MTASTVAQYLAALPVDRRAALSAVRKAINENLPDGYEEGIQFGMIGCTCFRRLWGHLSVSEFQFSAFSLSVRGEEGETKGVNRATRLPVRLVERGAAVCLALVGDRQPLPLPRGEMLAHR
jgi:hypothetical protein